MKLHTFNRLLVTLVLGLVGGAASAKLAVGAAAPDFSTTAALAGSTFNYTLSDALKKGPVVLYFYPKAFTTGCTIEAKLFAEATDQFAALNATVIGVSADDIDTLKTFSTGPWDRNISITTRLVDTSSTPMLLKSVGAKKIDPTRLITHHFKLDDIIKAYDAALRIKPDMADRVSYVITPDAHVLYVYDSLNPDQHVTNTLAAIKSWQVTQKK